MNITRKWHKFLAVGCSHGIYQDESAIKAVLKFRKDYKPAKVIHLGDFCDTASLRGGAAGSKDEAVPLQEDFNMARKFLYQLEPTLVFIGNHEDRIYRLMDHHHANKAYLASKCVEELRAMVKAVKADFVEDYDIEKSWRKIGDTMFGHGFMYNDNALRDHAEAFGKCCIAHIHTPGQTIGRNHGSPAAYCVGTLADISKLGYARARRATLRWNNGWVFGEYCQDQTVLWVVQKTRNGEYRLPM